MNSIELCKQMRFTEIVKYEKYNVTNNGIIIDKMTLDTLPLYYSTNGNVYVLLDNIDKTKKFYLVDRIVAITFDIPVLKNNDENMKMTINHKDGNTRNNYVENLEWVNDDEIWKIISYPKIKKNMYMVSNHGNVKNAITGKNISQELDKDGYPKLSLYGYNCRITIHTHRLVAYEFIKCNGDISPLHLCVNHINGDKCNNHVLNLEWVDNTTNQRHAWESGLKKSDKGEKHSNAKLTDNQVHLICQLLKKHKKKIIPTLNDIRNYQELSNIKRRHIESIRNKHAWTHISNKYFSHDEYRQKLNEADVCDICELLLDNSMDCNKTLEQFNKSHDYSPTLRTIQRIKDKEMWKNVANKYF